MTNSERIALSLEGMFRCFDCKRWLPLVEVAKDIRQDAEQIAGVQCLDCERDLWLLAEQWPSREVA